MTWDIFQAAGLHEPVDQRIVQHVTQLTLQGVRKVSEMRRHINAYVKDQLFRGTAPPPSTRRRYFPNKSDIRNLMNRARNQNRHSKVKTRQQFCTGHTVSRLYISDSLCQCERPSVIEHTPC